MKFSEKIIYVIIGSVPFLAYLDKITIGTYGYIEYIYVCILEVTILFMGIVIGMKLSKKDKERKVE